VFNEKKEKHVNRLRSESGTIDTIDAAILKALVSNARIANSELARIVGLSAPSTTERVKRLEEAGVIRGYHADIDPVALGLPLTVNIRVRPMPGQLQKLAALLSKLSEIVECHRVTGDDCFVAVAHVSSVGAMEKLIDKIIPYGSTNTSIIQSSPVPRRMPEITAR
jgi:Lrp/AsnC family transcriptional regulator, leucine-responsive regulatory protein